MLFDKYMARIRETIESIERTQKETILRVADRAAESIARGGVLHLFGSGHSHMIAEDAFNRAGGLVCVNAMLEPSLMELNVGRATLLERLSGYASVLLTGYELREGETVIVISNSGINAVPIEFAMECKAKGLHVAAITNLKHSRREPPRHPSGKKLYEVVDEVIDNCGEPGDAMLEHEGLAQKIGPSSTLAGIAIVHGLAVSIVEKLVSLGVQPPIYQSANTAGGDRHNSGLIGEYKNRIRYL